MIIRKKTFLAGMKKDNFQSRFAIRGIFQLRLRLKEIFRPNTGICKKTGEFDSYEKVDLDTVKFTLKMKPQQVKKFEYTLRTYHNSRQNDWKQND